MNKEEINQIIKDNPKVKQFLVTWKNRMNVEKSQPLRLFVATNGHPCYKLPNKRKWGHYLTDLGEILSITPAGKVKKELTDEEYIVENQKKIRKLFLSETHPNMWPKLVEGYRNLTDSVLLDILEQAKKRDADLFGLTHRFWQVVNDSYTGVHLLAGSHYKRLSVRGKMPRYWTDGEKDLVLAHALAAMDSGTKYRESWTTDYDYTLVVEEDRAWLNQEFKGCGNGHYWLLLNPNVAVFYEDD